MVILRNLWQASTPLHSKKSIEQNLEKACTLVTYCMLNNFRDLVQTYQRLHDLTIEIQKKLHGIIIYWWWLYLHSNISRKKIWSCLRLTAKCHHWHKFSLFQNSIFNNVYLKTIAFTKFQRHENRIKRHFHDANVSLFHTAQYIKKCISTHCIFFIRENLLSSLYALYFFNRCAPTMFC